MNELLININKHKNQNDINICYMLFNYIEEYNVQSEKELKEMEESNFVSKDLNTRINECFNSYCQDLTHFEELNDSDLKELTDYDNNFRTSQTTEEKLINIIQIYRLLEWTLQFPFQTYNLIINDKFN